MKRHRNLVARGDAARVSNANSKSFNGRKDALDFFHLLQHLPDSQQQHL